jgi:membrane-associated phospholipid phosphatase
MWGLVGMLLCLNVMMEDGSLLVPLMATIVLAGVVMTARLQLAVHTMTEIILGSVLGLVISITGVIILF